MNNAALRNAIVQALKKEKDFNGMVSADINANYFSATDIVLSGGEAYRIAVIKHNQPRQFFDEREPCFDVNKRTK